MDIEEMEELSFLIKDKETQNKLIQDYLNKKREFENSELSKQLSKQRKEITHYMFVTPHFTGETTKK